MFGRSLDPSDVSARAPLAAALANAMTTLEMATFNPDISPEDRPPVPNRLCIPATKQCAYHATKGENFDSPTFADSLNFVASGLLLGDYLDPAIRETLNFAAGAIVRPDRAVRVAAGYVVSQSKRTC